ncbi:pimeloyl-ACP methyl ester carboxylesterase [Kribbella aluminosa]|uniref:Pimeloyl-ACP methyl ester carboxylesterase n=1 Tax=Kribbella aluminosa TaxID=416017 RepID=A0ABS4UN54_9ACTN|nr:alpha/beta hydrolase [Kribbella aluminosa]MBP2353070.1 pimeloyl-ACP methyl ester carboxylesterase [Kribbella aluminosa]
MTTEKLYEVNNVELCAETFGDPADPALLLIHGAGASMLWWERELCGKLAARGRFVIRYDQRDTGRSTSYPVGAPTYAMSDLAADAVGLLDTVGVDKADVVAVSMSGGTALILGLDHPSRVASLTFVSTTTGDDGLPPPSMPHFDSPDFTDPAAVEEYVVRSIEAEAAGHFDEPAARELVRQDLARARDYEASLTNHFAMTFDGPRNGGFADLRMPVLVLHGDADPLLPLPHGEAIRDAVPDARLIVLAGMGHGLSEPYWSTFVDALVEHTERSR